VKCKGTGLQARRQESSPELKELFQNWAHRRVQGDLSSLTQNHPVPKEVLQTKRLFCVRLSDLEQADKNKFSAARKDLKGGCLSEAGRIFSELAQPITAKAKIEINKELL